MTLERWVLSLLIVLFSVCAYPAIHKCKNANGQWVFTDKPSACNKVPDGNGLEAPPALPSLPETEKPAKHPRPTTIGREVPDKAEQTQFPAGQPQPTTISQTDRVSGRGSPNGGGKQKFAYALLAIGVIISLYYGVILLAKAFQASVLWGLGYLFVPMVALLFVAVHWEAAKRPFLRSFWALPFLLAGWALSPLPWEGGEYEVSTELQSPVDQEEEVSSEEQSPVGGAGQNPKFECEGKTRCAQMTSCEEAEYYLDHCQNVEMDGDNDGIPCEDTLCGH